MLFKSSSVDHFTFERVLTPDLQGKFYEQRFGLVHAFFIRINSIRISRLKNLENLRISLEYAEAEMSKTKKKISSTLGKIS